MLKDWVAKVKEFVKRQKETKPLWLFYGIPVGVLVIIIAIVLIVVINSSGNTTTKDKVSEKNTTTKQDEKETEETTTKKEEYDKFSETIDGIKIEVSCNEIENKKMNFKKLDDEELTNTFKSKLDIPALKMYMFEMKIDGSNVNSSYQVKLSDLGYDETNTKVYYIKEDNEVEEVTAVWNENVLEFTVSNLGSYAVVELENQQESTSEQQPLSENQTSNQQETTTQQTSGGNSSIDTNEGSKKTNPLLSQGITAKTLRNVSVHDPSVVKVGDKYWIFGSHGAAAYSTDLINWTSYTDGVNRNNKLWLNGTKNLLTEMSEAFTYVKTDSYWAPDAIKLKNGKYAFYYCSCIGNYALGCIGIAYSDNIEGPYTNDSLMIKSDAPESSYHPNAIDPCVYWDKTGENLYMVYGSYSGGIFILKLDPYTGKILENQPAGYNNHSSVTPNGNYGKKISGGNHAPIEGAYIMYSPESDYYYYFVSYGGLLSTDGYNIRVARSKNPDGPFLDGNGNDISKATTNNNKDSYTMKLMGNYKFSQGTSYYSPGHNSAIYEKSTGKYYLIFHTRLRLGNEGHEVRTHQMFLNEDGWFVAAPYRNVGDTISTAYVDDLVGSFELVEHGISTTSALQDGSKKTLTFSKINASSGTISGTYSGTWSLSGDHNITIKYGNKTYKGVVFVQWNEGTKKYSLTISAQSGNNTIMLVRK